MRKSTMHGKRGTIIGLGGFFQGEIVAKTYPLAISTYVGIPFSFPGLPMHALKAAPTIDSQAPVLRVLGLGGFANIGSPIVERVMVFVVHFLARGAIEYHAMHSYLSFIAALSGGGEAPARCAPDGVPVPPRKPVKIFRINDGVLALRKWDKAIRFIGGLSDLLPGDLVRSALHGAAILS